MRKLLTLISGVVLGALMTFTSLSLTGCEDEAEIETESGELEIEDDEIEVEEE
jgi:hypothetical protein